MVEGKSGSIEQEGSKVMGQIFIYFGVSLADNKKRTL